MRASHAHGQRWPATVVAAMALALAVPSAPSRADTPAVSAGPDACGKKWSELAVRRLAREFLAREYPGLPAVHVGNGAYVVTGRTGAEDVVVPIREGQSLRFVPFARTNRTSEQLRALGLYPSDFLDVERLRGKRILDLGAGGGAFVDDLRASGVEAYGVDLYITPAQGARGWFAAADARRMPYPDAHFDHVYSSFSFLSYMEKISPDEVSANLREIRRVLKVGGTMRISPLSRETVERALRSVPGLAIRGAGEDGWAKGQPDMVVRGKPWVEIVRQPD